MDFLDFNGVGQYYLSENVTAAGLPRNSSFRAASETKISVPAMVWLEELRPRNENPNIFQVYLEKDKEYTFEFSRNFTGTIDANFPELQIFDPENAALPFMEASSLRPEITPIPVECPSLICYTIRSEFSGYYLVRVSSQKSSVETYAESEDLEIDSVEYYSEDEKFDKDYPHFKVGFNENDVANNKFIKEDLSTWHKYGGMGFSIAVEVMYEFPDYAKDRSETFPDNTRPFYYEGGPRNTNGSNGTDLRGHTFGKRSFHWKFQRSAWNFLRRIEYEVFFKLIDMPAEKYPFIGLED